MYHFGCDNSSNNRDIIVGCGVYCSFFTYKKVGRSIKNSLFAFIPFVVVASYCFIWWMATKNHCVHNSKFMVREFGIFMFAISAGIIYCLKMRYIQKSR